MGLDLTGATDNPDDEDDVQITYEGPARVHGLTSPLRAIAEAARAHGPGNPRASGNGNEPVDGVTVKLESDSEEEREQPETRAPDLESSDSDQFPGDGPANADWPESDSEPGSSPLPSPSFSALLRNSGPGSQSCGTPAKGTPKSSASPLRQKDLNIGASVLGLDFSQASKPFLGLAAERHVPSEDEDGRSEASGDQANSLSGDGAAEEDEPTEEEEGEKEDVAEWRTDDERDHLGQPATEEDQAPAASVVGLGLQDWDPMEGDAGDGVTEGSGADKVHSEGAGTEDSSSSEEDSEYGPAWRARTPTAPVIRRRTFGRKRKGDRHGSSGGDDDTSVSEAPPRPPPLKRQRGDSADDEDIDAPTRAYFEALHDPADYAKEGSTYGKALGVWQSTRAELTRTKGTFGQLLGDGTSKCDPVLVRYDSEDSGGIKRCMSPLVRAVKLRCDSGSSAQSSTGVFPLVVKPGDSSNPFRIIKTCKDYEKNPLFLLLERQSKGNDVVFDVAFLHLCSDRLTLELGGLFASRFWVGIGECKSILVGPADQKLVNKLPALTASKLSRNNVLRLLFPDAPLPVPAAPRARAASVLTEASPAVPAQPRTAAASSAQREKKDPQAAVAAISPRLQAPPEEPATYPDDDPEKNEHLRLGLLQIAKAVSKDFTLGDFDMRRRIDKTDIFRHNSTKSKWVVKRLVADVTGRPTCLKVKEALCQLAGQHIPSVAPIQIILGSDNGIVGLVLPEYRQSLRHFLNDACEHGRHKPGPNMHPFFTQNELREVVQGVKDITRALQDLHDLRIFHFDLDESNVMLRHNPGARKNDWILIDFGAARTTDRGSHAAYLSNFGEESPSEAELDSSIVRTRKRFGHDDKRPPETRRKAVQAVAVAKDVSKDIPIIVVDGQAVDMYQWGGTLFNVLFPTCRFSDKRPMRTIFEEAIRATFPGVGVDRMSALLAGHGSSRLWTSTLFRALSPKPDDRYTARDMLDTLEGATEDDLVQGMMFAID